MAKALEEYIKETSSAYETQIKKETDEIGVKYDNDIKNLKDAYNLKTEEINKNYDSLLRENEVQRVLNKRYLERKAAELGLTDSGLNRTQQTALQITSSKNTSNIQTARQSAVDALASEMTAKINEINSEKTSAKLNVENSYNELIGNIALSAYNSDVTAETEKEKAEKESADAQKSDYTDTLTQITANLSNLNLCASLIDKYAEKYDIDEYGTDMNVLLNASGLNADEFKHYLKFGTIYATPAENKNNSGISGYSPGRELDYASYISSGLQEYRVRLRKATWNYFGGIDGNDRVDILHPDGTVLAENIKLKFIANKDSAQKITDWTAGKTKNDYNTETTMMLDLSNTRYLNY